MAFGFNEAFQFEILAVMGILSWRDVSHQIKHHTKIVVECYFIAQDVIRYVSSAHECFTKEGSDASAGWFLPLSDEKNTLFDR